MVNQVYLSALTANIGSFSAGTVITWSSPEIDKLKSYDNTPFDNAITKDQGSWISSFFPLGAAFGPFIFGYLSDRIGKKYTILVTGVPLVLSYLLMAFGKLVILFYTARFVSGMCVGGFFTILPNYIGEIVEAKDRGALSSGMNIFLCLGMLFPYTVGPYSDIWVFNLLLSIFPFTFLIFFYYFGTESPQFHIRKKNNEMAKVVLQKLRGPNTNIERELMDIQKKMDENGEGSFMDIFKSRGLTKAFVISVGLLTFQQFTGINAVLFYAQSIFDQAGSSLEPAICSIIIGCVQLASSFTTPLLVERLGRKLLLLISAVSMMIAELPLGIYSYLRDNGHDVKSISFLPILCLVVFIMTYTLGFGPLPWSVMGELFPSNVKSVASSVSAAICWMLGFLVANYFQSISDSIGMGPSFWIFSGSCGCASLFVYFFVFETKGKTLDQIQDELNS